MPQIPESQTTSAPPLPPPPSSSNSPTNSQEPEEYPCEISQSKVSVPGFVCKGQLLFEDNFESTIEKGKIWTPEIKFPGEPVGIN